MASDKFELQLPFDPLLDLPAMTVYAAALSGIKTLLDNTVKLLLEYAMLSPF